MIDKDSLLNDKEFLKSFKNGLELQSFFRELQARAVSQMLEGEMDGHLGYEKHERSGQGNSRNGHTRLLITLECGKTYSSTIILT